MSRPAAARLVVVSTLATGLLLGSVAGAQAAKRATACQPSGTKTVVAGPGVRVFTRRGPKRVAGEPDRSRVTRLYGCRAGKRPVAMATAGTYSAGTLSFGQVQVAGRFAAVVSAGDDRGGFSQELEVFDLARRRRAFRFSPPQEARIRDSVLARSGNAAWIQTAQSPGQDPQAEPVFNSFEVRARVGARTIVLDSGPAIAPTSLAASGPTLYWTNGGRAVAGRLP